MQIKVAIKYRNCNFFSVFSLLFLVLCFENYIAQPPPALFTCPCAFISLVQLLCTAPSSPVKSKTAREWSKAPYKTHVTL